MSALRNDVRYAVRRLFRSRGVAVAACVSLGLGIGANATIFSALNALLIRPLPFAQPERLVQLWTTRPAQGLDELTSSLPNVRDWEEQARSLKGVAAFSSRAYTLTSGDRPEMLQGAAASASLFRVLGVGPALGRTFAEGEDLPGAEPVVVLGHAAWQERFGGDPSIVGRSVGLDGRPHTVVGVMPPGVEFPHAGIEMWTPLRSAPGEWPRERGGLGVVARLADGATVEAARTELGGIAARLASTHPAANEGTGVRVLTLREAMYAPELRLALFVLLSVVGFVLLIACANLANLLLARAIARRQEMAVRAALGAPRGRLVKQMLVESVVLALPGGALGLLLAAAGAAALPAVIPADIPRAGQIGIDGRVLAFTAVLSLATGIVFGLAPALRASRPDLSALLKEGGRGSAGGRTAAANHLLVAGEICVAVVLLALTGLMIRSVANLQRTDLGFDAERVLTLRVSGPPEGSGTDEVAAFYGTLRERLSDIPGVAEAGAVSTLPLGGVSNWTEMTVEGAADAEPASVGTISATPGYLPALGVPLLRGREISEADRAGSAPVVVVNRTLADRFWPGADAVGGRLHLGESGPDGSPLWRTVVGVAGDVRYRGATRPARPEVYLPFAQAPWRESVLVVRTPGDPAAVASAVRQAVWSVHPGQAVHDLAPLAERVRGDLRYPRVFTALLAIFGGIALLLTAVGVYGVISYAVAQRTHEFGVRMALGATASQVVLQVVRRGLLLAAVGLAAGAAGALLLGGVLGSLLHGVGADDPLTLGTVAAALVAVALVASYVPARRATRVDPLLAMRSS